MARLVEEPIGSVCHAETVLARVSHLSEPTPRGRTDLQGVTGQATCLATSRETLSSWTLSGVTAPLVLADLTNPYARLAELRKQGQVVQVDETRVFLVLSWAAVEEAIGRPGDFSSNLSGVLTADNDGFDVLPIGDPSVPQVLATADDPSHAAQRRLVMCRLGNRVRSLADDVAVEARACWDARPAGTVEWMSVMADRLPMRMVASLIGLPPDEADRLLQWAYDSTEMLGGVVADDRLEKLLTSTMNLVAYLDDALRRTAADDDSLLGLLKAAIDAEEMTHDEAVIVLVQLVGAGGESTAGLIGNAARHLADHPDLQRQVRADPDLLDRFLDESLRLESPFRGHYREVKGPCELAGVELVAGDRLLLMWSAANRDPDKFDDPDTFSLDRPASRSHLAFGKGIHFCVGSALARLEATAALQLLLQNSSWIAVDNDNAAVWVPSYFIRRHEVLRLHVS